MPIKQNKPFNPCPDGQVLCNPMDGNDMSCCFPEDPKVIKQKENLESSGPPKARSNIPHNLPRFNYDKRPTKNIRRDIVVSGNRPIPKVRYAKDGTRRSKVTEKRVYSGKVQSNNNNGSNDTREPTPCCSQSPGSWSCSEYGQYNENCLTGTHHPGAQACSNDYSPEWGRIRGLSGTCCCFQKGSSCWGDKRCCNSQEVLEQCGNMPWWWQGGWEGPGEGQYQEPEDICSNNPDGYNLYSCWDGTCVHQVWTVDETTYDTPVVTGFYTVPQCPEKPWQDSMPFHGDRGTR